MHVVIYEIPIYGLTIICSMSERSMDKAWMGLTKKEKNCDSTADDDCRVKGWQWQDGSPYNYSLHDLHGDHEPKRTELCAGLHRDDKYNGLLSEPCHFSGYYICEQGKFLWSIAYFVKFTKGKQYL